MNQLTCLVTGGAHGIGWAISKHLAERGANVFACDVSPEHLSLARHEREQCELRNRIDLFQADVTDTQSLNAWFDHVIDSRLRVDVLINNAGIFRWNQIEEQPLCEAKRILDVGFVGTVRCTSLVLPKMLQQQSGRIINIGSVASELLLCGGYAAYAATKAAVDAYTQILQLELRQTPVRASLIRPGLVKDTELFQTQVMQNSVPTIARWLPLVTPQQIAIEVEACIKSPKRIVTVPRYYRFLHLLYWLHPPFSHWLCSRNRVYQ